MARLFDMIDDFRTLPVTPVVVDISNVNAFYMMHEKEEWVISEDFPNCAPPFWFSFYEFKSPMMARIKGKVYERHDVALFNHGIMVEAIEKESNADLRAFMDIAKRVFKMGDPVGAQMIDRLYTMTQNARWMCMGVFYFAYGERAIKSHYCFWCVDAKGGMIETEDGSPFLLAIPENLKAVLDASGELEGWTYSKAASEYNAGFFNPYLLATSFTHCKNVTRIEHVPPEKINKRRAKEGKPPLTKYYTLQIDPMREVLRKEGGYESNGLKRAMHICRGHFAIYDEKPLFGKVKGTFWIPQHVKGSKTVGEIKKDYNVNPKKD